MPNLPVLEVCETFTEREIPASPIPHTTYLFRSENEIVAACDLALGAYKEGNQVQPFTVLSVGCSIGAEVDSLLVHASRLAPEIGKVTIVGLDINQKVLEQAERGEYVTWAPSPWNREGRVDLKPFEAILPEFRFSEYKTVEGEPRCLISTYDFRRQHNVSFRLADLAEADIDLPAVDLLLCNHVLQHLSKNKKQIERLIMGLFSHLKTGGVLSIGAAPADKDTQRYINEVINEYPLEPLAFSIYLGDNFPFIFQKKSAQALSLS